MTKKLTTNKSCFMPFAFLVKNSWPRLDRVFGNMEGFLCLRCSFYNTHKYSPVQEVFVCWEQLLCWKTSFWPVGFDALAAKSFLCLLFIFVKKHHTSYSPRLVHNYYHARNFTWMFTRWRKLVSIELVSTESWNLMGFFLLF